MIIQENNNESEERVSYLKILLFGLTVECPLGGHPKDCPLEVLVKVRKKSAIERREWVNGLSLDEIIAVHTNCQNCLAEREA